MTSPASPPIPPPAPPASAPHQTGTHPLAVLALVATLVLAPVGLVLGPLALDRVRVTGRSGSGLATTAVIIGAIGTAPLALVVLMFSFNS